MAALLGLGRNFPSDVHCADTFSSCAFLKQTLRVKYDFSTSQAEPFSLNGNASSALTVTPRSYGKSKPLNGLKYNLA